MLLRCLTRPPCAGDLARRHAKEAIAALVEALDDPRHGRRAARALIRRGWGSGNRELAAEIRAAMSYGDLAQAVGITLPRPPQVPVGSRRGAPTTRQAAQRRGDKESVRLVPVRPVADIDSERHGEVSGAFHHLLD
jgi:hypothetical protein